jgi:dihydroorotate dehydrogenase (fumarate)
MMGASPLSDHLDTVRRLEDAGCAAIVLHSLFEEQISQEDTGRIHHMDPLDRQFATVLSYFPEPKSYALGPHEYLEHVRRVKDAVKIPVVGSINGTTPEAWLKFARLVEQAGADARELNTQGHHRSRSDWHRRRKQSEAHRGISSTTSRSRWRSKLSPFFTAFGSVARRLDRAGANGLVLFNRFPSAGHRHQHLAVWPRLELSASDELLLRLR